MSTDGNSKRRFGKEPDLIRSFLPVKIIESQKSSAYEYADNIVFCADISGFTNMSEKLSEMGREGSEEVTRIINLFFQPLIEIIYGHGGDIIYFGGDAITAMFDIKHPFEALYAAVEATEFVEKTQNVKTSEGVFKIGIHTALNADKTFFQHTGKHYILAGRACFKVIDLLDNASAGEIVLSSSMAGLLPGVLLKKADEDCYKVSAPYSVIEKKSYKKKSEQKLRSRSSADSENYIPDWIIRQAGSKKAFDQKDGEHRKAAVIFMHFRNIPYDDDQKFSAEQVSVLLDALSKGAVKYKGWINKIDFYKDGIRALIIFGIPQKLDNDEKHAVLFADEILKDDRLMGISMRVGINSGNIFKTPVGSAKRMEMTVMGDTVNTAARIAAKAEERRISTGERVYEKTKGDFRYGESKARHMKGKKGAVRVFEVESAAGASAGGKIEEWLSESRKLVGNEKLMEDFTSAQKDSLNGTAAVFAIEGEAGMGKSRIIREARKGLAKKGFEILEGSCLSYGSALAYHPWTEILNRLFRIYQSDSSEERRRKINEAITNINPSLKMWAPLIGNVMNVDFPSNDVIKNLDNSLKMQKFFDIMEEILIKTSESKPLCIIIEDYHWADRSSSELFVYLAERIKKRRLLFFIAFRPTAVKENFKNIENLHEHKLKELNEQETKELIEDLLDVKELPGQIKSLITEKSQGNPFYVEELVKSLIESGSVVRDSAGNWAFSGESEEVVLPDSVEDIILSRIDRLEAEEKEVLQAASILGREFEGKVLKRLCGKIDDVEQSMEKLRGLDLIRVDEQNSEKYAFKHIMTCETAYNTISFAKRRSMHSEIGRIFEGSGGKSKRDAGLLSYHYMMADDGAKAAKYSIEAGEKAKAVYANDEAIEYFTRALKACGTNDGLKNFAVKSYIGRASVYSFLGRGSDAELDSEKSIEIAESIDDKSFLAECYIEMSVVYELMSNFDRMKETAEKALEIYEKLKDAYGMAKSYNYIGMFFGITGKPDIEKDYLEKTIGLLNIKTSEEIEKRNEGRKRKTGKYVSSLSSALLGIAQNNIGYVYRLLGDLDTALEHYKISLKIRREIGDRIGEAQSLNNVGMVFGRRGKTEKALLCFNKSVDIYEEIGNKKGLGSTLVNIGFLNGKLGRKDKEIEVYLRALEIQEQIGDKYVMSYTLTNIGKYYFESGSYDKSLESHMKALSIRQEINDMSGIGNSFYYVGQSFGALDDRKSQIENYLKALEVYREVKDLKSIKMILPEIIKICENGNEPEETSKYQKMLSEIEEK